MIVLRIVSMLVGVGLASTVIGSALKTVVLPQEGTPRLSQFVFALVYRLLVHRWRNASRTRQLRRMYAPVALVSLALAWMLGMVIAFTLIFWGTGGGITLQRAFDFSGSSLTTLGFSEPDTTSRIWLAFIEATIGLGLVALLISYLPTIYTAYNGREKGVIRMRPLAGSPPAAPDLLRTLHRIGALDGQDFWRMHSEWILDLEQTHTAFPILSYFPETHRDHSWVATAGTLLDAAALVMSTKATLGADQFSDQEMGPLSVLVYGMPAFVRVAAAASIPVSTPTRFQDLQILSDVPLPPIAVSETEFLSAMATLAPIIGGPAQPDQAWRTFVRIRSAYEPSLRALAGLTKAPAAPWTTDRPARVGKPRFMSRRHIAVDWSVQGPDPVAEGGDAE